MAEKEKEEKGKEDKKDEGAKASEGGGSKNIILMAAIIGGMLAVMIAVTVVFINKTKPVDPEIIAEKVKQKEEEEARIKETAMGAVMKPPITVIVNLAGDSERFLKAELSLEYMPKEGAEGGGEKKEGHGGGGGGGNPEIEKRLPKIKDIVIDVLSSKTFDELKDRDGRRKVLAQLKNDINKIFPEPETVTNVYFESFIIQ